MPVQQDPRSPSVRRRRLSAELRRARKVSGLTTGEASKRAKISVGKLSMIENSEIQTVKPDDLDKLLTIYKVEDSDKRDVLHQLARDAKIRGWWSKYKDVFKDESLPDFEAEASTMRTYQSQVFPGLLQTPSYTHALLQGGRFTDPKAIERKVEARMARREILTRFDPVRLRAIIDEAAFYRPIGGPKVRLDQHRHLLHMAQMPHIDIQVLPFSKGPHAGLSGPFIILDFPNPLDTPIICVPTLTDALYLEQPEDVETYSTVFGDVQGSAISAAESAEYIAERIKTLESTQ